MDFETAQNKVISSVANAGLSPDCVGPAMESAQYAFHAASEYGPNSPEAANVAEYANDTIANSCARFEIPTALDVVHSAAEMGAKFH